MHYLLCSGETGTDSIKKHAGARYAECVCLHLVGSVGLVVHSSGSGGETLTHYFLCSGGTGIDSTKGAGRRYIELVLHPVRSVIHQTYVFAFGGICM
jgi:hypothetical protein